MADTQPQYQRGAGGDPTSPPLPQGEATELNQAAQMSRAQAQLSAAPAASGEQAVPPPPPGPRDAPVNFKPQTELQQFLYGPPDPNAPQSGASPPDKVPLPPSVAASLPIAQEAASDPQASPQVRALLRALAQQVR